MMDAADIIVEIGGIFQNSLIIPSDSRADDFAYSYFLQLWYKCDVGNFSKVHIHKSGVKYLLLFTISVQTI